jgi:hypothetical protein
MLIQNAIKQKCQKKWLSASLLAILAYSAFIPANAYYPDYYHYRDHRTISAKVSDFMYDHPYVGKAAIGGGAGALIGGIVSPDGDRAGGAVKGALIGGAAGVGYELLREKGVFGW